MEDPSVRILCPKPVITRNEPGLQWLIGSPFFPDPLAIVSTFRCMHSAQPAQSVFSVDYAKESVFRPLSRTGSCLHSLRPLETLYSNIYIPRKPVKLRPFCSYSIHIPHPMKKKTRRSSLAAYVADASDWASQEGDSTATTTLEQGEQGVEQQWGVQEAEAMFSDWEGDEEPAVVVPPEEAKLFVGNLPYDVNSEKLAMLFEQADVVKFAEEIYNRDTGQSRGFGFVTMSTVEEAEKAVETFNQYDLDGRLLTVKKAAPRGSRPERSPRAFGSSFRIYVGNLPWDVDSACLEQVFNEHGKVVNARVVFDRETGRSRGFGFVSMASKTEMSDAIAALDGQSLDGRESNRVNVAEERPRRSF